MASRDIGVGQFTGQCCWCGEPADSDEDIVSRWMEREIAPEPAVVAGNPVLRSLGADGRVRSRPVQRLATSLARVRAVCRVCNNEWMSVQEMRVQPLLGPLIRGHQRQLSLQDQVEIAYWASIKSVVCDARPGSSDGGLVSQAIRKAIYEDQRPADDMIVRLAAYEGAYDLGITGAFAVGTGPTQQHLAQWVTTILAGHLVVQVVGRTGSLHAPVLDELPGGAHDGTSFTVWPPQAASVQWPPPHVLSVETLAPFLTELLPDAAQVEGDILGERGPCSRCGAQHGPYVRDLPVLEG